MSKQHMVDKEMYCSDPFVYAQEYDPELYDDDVPIAALCGDESISTCTRNGTEMNKFEAGRYAASFMPPVLRLTRTVSGMPFNDGMYLLADHLKTELKELPAIANELYTLASRPTGSCGSTMNPVMNSDLRQAVIDIRMIRNQLEDMVKNFRVANDTTVLGMFSSDPDIAIEEISCLMHNPSYQAPKNVVDSVMFLLYSTDHKTPSLDLEQIFNLVHQHIFDKVPPSNEKMNQEHRGILQKAFQEYKTFVTTMLLDTTELRVALCYTVMLTYMKRLLRYM